MKAIVNIEKVKNPYLIVIFDSAGIKKEAFKRKGIFDYEYKIKDTDFLLIDKSSLKNYNLEFEGNKSWNSFTNRAGYKPQYNFDWNFIAKNHCDTFTDKAIDSLIILKLPPSKSLYNSNFKGY